MPLHIIINVFGGMVQDVFCSHAQAQVTVVDWDSEGAITNDLGLVEVETTTGALKYPSVTVSPALPMSDLAGTDVEAALEAAEKQPVP